MSKLGIGKKKDKKVTDKEIEKDLKDDPKGHKQTLQLALDEVQQIRKKENITVEEIKEKLPKIKKKYNLKSLTLEKDNNHLYHPVATVNPSLPGPKEVEFTEAELQELNKTAILFAKQIKEKKHIELYRKNPLKYLTGKLQTGDIVESTATPGLEVLAKEGGFTLLKGVHLRFVGSSGQFIGGKQAELDFIMLGENSVEKIVSAKLSPKQFEPKTDRKHLKHYNSIPSDVDAMREYLKQHFGGAANTYISVNKVVVVINGTQVNLDTFKTKYLTQTPIDKIIVESVTPGPEHNQGNQLRVSKGVLLDKTIELINNNL